MADNKNQHFVPRCYLKPFTLNREGNAIHLYNINRKLLIDGAPVKNQCSQDYFYGKNLVLEKELQKAESEYSTTLATLSLPGYKLMEKHSEVLLAFWLLQFMRTEAASKREVEMFAQIDDFVDSADHRINMTMSETVAAAIYRFWTIQFNFQDMKVCLFKNLTDIPFVTSDDPAVLANKWHAIRNNHSLEFHGLSSAGAIFLLPLTPEIFFIAYDGDVYQTESINGWAILNDTADVNALNEHQYLNCKANIYFDSWKMAEFNRNSAEAMRRRRPPARHQLNFGQLESQNDEKKVFRQVDIETARKGSHILMHMVDVRSNPASWPSKLKFRKRGKAYRPKTGSGYIRAGQIRFLADAEYRKVATP